MRHSNLSRAKAFPVIFSLAPRKSMLSERKHALSVDIRATVLQAMSSSPTFMLAFWPRIINMHGTMIRPLSCGTILHIFHKSLRCTWSQQRFQPSGRLTDRVASVTRCSSRLGRAIASRYAARGARVVCADLQPGALNEGKALTGLQNEIQELSGRSHFFKTDANVEVKVKDLIRKSCRRIWPS